MTSLPPLLAFTVTAGLGLYMGVQYLLGTRNKPMLIAIHLMSGLAGLEIMAVTVRGLPEGSLAPTAALILAGALLTGLAVPVLAKSRPGSVGVLLGSHAAVAMVGIGVFLLWALRA